MVDMTEERVWKYLIANQTATAEEIALNCDVDVAYASRILDRIGTPVEVRAKSVAPAATEARKDDSAKIRLELVPPEMVFAIGDILTFGAKKYDDRNWELGMSWGRVFGALMRHLWAWWGGKGPTAKSFLLDTVDSETQRSHLWHAACCLTFLVAYEERSLGTDDRPTTQTGE